MSGTWQAWLEGCAELGLSSGGCAGRSPSTAVSRVLDCKRQLRALREYTKRAELEGEGFLCSILRSLKMLFFHILLVKQALQPAPIPEEAARSRLSMGRTAKDLQPASVYYTYF